MPDYDTNSLCFVADSPVHGRGLFARHNIPADTWIGHYDGPQTRENGMHVLWVEAGEDGETGEEWVGYDGEQKSTQFGLKSLRLARKLEPGFVLTIEPGVYFIPDLIDMWRAENKFSNFINWDKVEQYKYFGGCRNEEDFVITESGARLLGKPLPKTIKDVEAER